MTTQQDPYARQRRYRERRRQNPQQVTCPGCGAVHVTSGSDNSCKTCRAAYHRARRADPAKGDRIKARQREWYYANLDRERALRRKYGAELKQAAIEAYGGKCACCAEHRIEFLAIDHINGGGKKHRQQASGVGRAFYSWLRRQGYPQGELRVLCHNCNQSHGLYGYCPHDREREAEPPVR